jgi:hypothetical protein
MGRDGDHEEQKKQAQSKPDPVAGNVQHPLEGRRQTSKEVIHVIRYLDTGGLQLEWACQ